MQRELAGDREGLHERAPEHARGDPSEQLLGWAAPACDGSISIRKNEAGIHELAQQLFNSLRLGGRGTRLWLGHLSVSVGTGAL